MPWRGESPRPGGALLLVPSSRVVGAVARDFVEVGTDIVDAEVHEPVVLRARFDVAVTASDVAQGACVEPKRFKRQQWDCRPQKALSEKVTVKQGDREHTLTMAEAGIKQLVAQYAKGDRHARRDVVIYAEKLGIDLIAGHRNTIKQALAADRQAILDAYFEHRTQVTELCKSSPVLAPPELLDDDAEDST